MNKYPTAVRLPSGSYRCQVMVDGKRRSVTADSPMEAISLALALRDGETKKSPQDQSLGAVVDEYIESRESILSPSTLKAYRSYRRTRFPAYMERRISELDRRTLQRMVNEEARKIKPKALKNAYALISSALKDYGVDTEVNLPQIPASERPWLTADEVLRFCRVVQGESCEIPALLALCSLRLSEIAALTWEDIDLKAGTIRVRRSVVAGDHGLVEKQTNKTASSTRTVPIMIPQLAEALKAVSPKEGRVLAIHPNTLRKQVNRICEREGLPCVGAHGLRHSFASLCHYLKVPELEAARLGGWSDLSTMRKIYTHLSDRQIGDAAATLSRFFG